MQIILDELEYACGNASPSFDDVRRRKTLLGLQAAVGLQITAVSRRCFFASMLKRSIGLLRNPRL